MVISLDNQLALGVRQVLQDQLNQHSQTPITIITLCRPNQVLLLHNQLKIMEDLIGQILNLLGLALSFIKQRWLGKLKLQSKTKHITHTLPKLQNNTIKHLRQSQAKLRVVGPTVARHTHKILTSLVQLNLLKHIPLGHGMGIQVSHGKDINQQKLLLQQQEPLQPQQLLQLLLLESNYDSHYLFKS